MSNMFDMCYYTKYSFHCQIYLTFGRCQFFRDIFLALAVKGVFLTQEQLVCPPCGRSIVGDIKCNAGIMNTSSIERENYNKLTKSISQKLKELRNAIKH